MCTWEKKTKIEEDVRCDVQPEWSDFATACQKRMLWLTAGCVMKSFSLSWFAKLTSLGSVWVLACCLRKLIRLFQLSCFFVFFLFLWNNLAVATMCRTCHVDASAVKRTQPQSETKRRETKSSSSLWFGLFTGVWSRCKLLRKNNYSIKRADKLRTSNTNLLAAERNWTEPNLNQTSLKENAQVKPTQMSHFRKRPSWSFRPKCQIPKVAVAQSHTHTLNRGLHESSPIVLLSCPNASYTKEKNQRHFLWISQTGG